MKQFRKPSNRSAFRTPTPFPASGEESGIDSDAASIKRSRVTEFKPFKVERSSMPAVVESSDDEVEFVELPKKAQSASHSSKNKDEVKDKPKSMGQTRARIVYTKPGTGKIDDADGGLEPSPKIVDLARAVKDRPKPIPIFKGKPQRITHAYDEKRVDDKPVDDDDDNSSERTPRVSRTAIQDDETTPVARNISRSASPIDTEVTPKATRTGSLEKYTDASLTSGSIGRQTRASNGISKKRVLQDAAIISSDDELPTHITPKKPRISTAKPSVRVDKLAFSTQEDDDTDDDDITLGDRKIEPIKLSTTIVKDADIQSNDVKSTQSKGKARADSDAADDVSPFAASQREHVSQDDVDDIFASDIATATRLSIVTAGDRRARVKADHSSTTKFEERTSEGRLHPDEIAAIDTAMRKTRYDALRAAKSAKESDTPHEAKPDPTTLTHNDRSTTPSAGQRRTFGQMVKTPGKTPMINAGSVLLDETMKFRVQSLPNRCDVTRAHLQDSILAEDYVNLPNLRLGGLRPWNAQPGSGSAMISVWFSGWADQCPNLDFDSACAAIRMKKYKNFVNPSRVSPLDLNILYTSNDNKRSILQANFKTAVCISPILTRDSYLLEPTTVGLRNKYLSGHFHHQEWERLEALACMVFDKKVMTAQIRDGALSFTTMGNVRGDREMSSPNRPPRNPSMLSAASSRAQSTKSKLTKPDANVRSVLDLTDDIPVYDARGVSLNFASDLEDLEERLPRWIDEIPSHSFAVVGYTMGHYEKDNRANLTTNILFVILLATEGSDE